MRITLLEYLRKTADTFPEKRAVVDEHGALTFRQLAEGGFSVASTILAAGGLPNRPILVFTEKSCAALTAIVGVLMSGNCYCPVDVSTPSVRLASMIRTLQPSLALTTAPLRKRLLEAGLTEEKIVSLEEIPSVSDPDLWSKVSAHIAPRIDTDPAYVIFTSGSTGEPKGVTVSHRGVIDYIEWARQCYEVDETEIIGNQSPLFFDNSTLDLYLCMATGATLHLIPEACFRFPVRLIEYLQTHRMTFIFWVPSVLVTVANLELLNRGAPESLRKVLFAGEVMPARQLRYWMDRLPQALFSNLYGPTEITVDCTYYHVPRDFTGDSVPIGKPCRNTDVLILTDDQRPASPYEIGELCVRGTSLALGYWNNPAETSRAFCQNPLHGFYNDPVYRTGDLVYYDPQGVIHFVGRRDSQIKHRGYRIELGEIEAAARSLSSVGQCSAVYDREAGEIHLFLEPTGTDDLASIRRQLAGCLPRYMVPGKYHLLERLPLTANGKLDRRSLQERAYREAYC